MQLRAYIERTFDVVRERYREDEVVFLCPLCGDQSGNRSVNLKNKKTSCWRCNEGGNIFKWLHHHGYDTTDLASEGLADVAVDEITDSIDEKEHLPFVEVDLPKGFTPVQDKPESYYYRAIKAMAERKHLTMQDMVKAGVGFTRGGKSAYWEPYAIFPVIEWGSVVYYQGRTYIDIEGEATKKFPSKKELPYGSRYWVYNIDRARRRAGKGNVRIILVESILNVLSLEKELKRRKIKGFVPLAVFKHAVSKQQLIKLRSLRNVEEVCLMFDSDASEASWKIASKLSSFPEVTIVEMPEGVDANDNAEVAVDLLMDRTKALRLNEGAERFVGLRI